MIYDIAFGHLNCKTGCGAHDVVALLKGIWVKVVGDVNVIG